MPNITISAPPDPGGTVARDHAYKGAYTTTESSKLPGTAAGSSKSAPALEAPGGSGSLTGTVTVSCRLEIGALTGGGAYDSGFVPANVISDPIDKTKGTWDNNFNLPSGTLGTNARITAKIFIDGTQVNGTPSIEDFQVLDPGTDLGTVNPTVPPPPVPGALPGAPAALLGGGAKVVGAAFAPAAAPAGVVAPAGMEFRVFSGQYQSPVTRIACRVQRQYVSSVITKSVADAYLFGGVWAAIILVPTTTPATASDWFIAEFADDAGLRWDTASSKIR